MNSIRFNIALGLFSIFCYFIFDIRYSFDFPNFVISIFGIALYLGEFWAFIHKIKFARIKELSRLSGDDPLARVELKPQFGLVFYLALFIRFGLRSFLAIYCIMISDGSMKEINAFKLIALILIVVFEIINLTICIYSTIGQHSSESKEPEIFWEAEKTSRIKNFNLLKSSYFVKKEFLVTLTLILMAFIITQFLWGTFNQKFYKDIIQTLKNEESKIAATIVILIQCTFYCFLFLMPIRLAFWIEEKIKADEKHEIRKYRLSIIFAAISICGPTLVQLVESFMLGKV